MTYNNEKKRGDVMKKRSGLIGLSFVIAITAGLYAFVVNNPIHAHQHRIGETYMTMNNTFYDAIHEEVKKITDEHNDILITRDPLLSVEKQLEQLDHFEQQHIDVLIINPVDGNDDRIINKLKELKRKGISIIVVDSQLKEDQFIDCTILSDNYNAGVLCAKDMMKNIKSAKILLLEHLAALSAVDRIKGFTDTIKNHPEYQIIDREDCSGQTEIAMPKMKAMIERHSHFDVLMALNDPSALGALAAIEEAKSHQSFMVYSVDGSPDMKKLINDTNGRYYTAAQSPLMMGKKAANNAYRLIKKKNVSAKVIVPVSLVGKNNISDYDLSGWQ